MKEEHKQCCSCGFYAAYYTIGYCNFYKKAIGLCRKYQKTVSNCDCCGKWSNDKSPKDFYKQKAIKAIPYMLNQLTAIAELLQESLEKEKQNSKKH